MNCTLNGDASAIGQCLGALSMTSATQTTMSTMTDWKQLLNVNASSFVRHWDIRLIDTLASNWVFGWLTLLINLRRGNNFFAQFSRTDFFATITSRLHFDLSNDLFSWILIRTLKISSTFFISWRLPYSTFIFSGRLTQQNFSAKRRIPIESDSCEVLAKESGIVSSRKTRRSLAGEFHVNFWALEVTRLT